MLTSAWKKGLSVRLQCEQQGHVEGIVAMNMEFLAPKCYLSTVAFLAWSALNGPILCSRQCVCWQS